MGSTLADLAYGICALVALLVGGRLVRLGLRTRQLPELVFGAATLTQILAGLGFWLLPPLLPEPAIWTGAAATLGVEAAGTIGVGLGCWLIFRRGQGWAVAAALGVALLAVGTTAARLALSDPSQASAATPLGHGDRLPLAQALTNVGVATAYGWLALEAVRYGLLMRRRLRLGLDRPIVVHQFLLWGVASGAIFLINVAVIAVVTATGRPPEEIAWAHGGTALVGLVGAAALWCSFFPPRAYRAWADRGAEAAG
ncbi:MAG: hypothetical protein R3263_11895 [Myxococcota bacterium]|nr:hypothetical protein [Myxococcota bacterium]